LKFCNLEIVEFENLSNFRSAYDRLMVLDYETTKLPNYQFQKGFLPTSISTVIDPKHFDERSFISVTSDVAIVPPNSFALARSVGTSRFLEMC
jgi:hypothetical protein